MINFQFLPQGSNPPFLSYFIIQFKLQQMSSKVQIFLFTFMCYTSVHALRTAYSSSKHDIQDRIQIQNKLMGILDSLMLLALGLGHFLHAVKPMKRPVRNLWIAMFVSAINFAIMPLLLYFQFFQNYFYLCIFQLINGFVQSYAWPTLLMLINSQYCSKKESALLGFWSTNANFGNILGYLFFQVLNFSWQVDLAIAGGFSAINGLIIVLRFKQLHKKDDKNTIITTIESSESVQQVLIYNGHGQVKEMQKPSLLLLKNLNIVLITTCFSLVKSVIYGIMLWLPLYFKTRDGFKEYAESIPITYDISAIFGSVFIGYLFTKIINKGLLMIPFMLSLVVCFSFLRFFDLGPLFVFIIIGAIGFCLGGTFNTLAGLIVIELTESLPQRVRSSSLGFYAAITMAAGNITTALTQILIGFVIGKQHQEGIFMVFMIYSSISLVCLVIVATEHELKRRKSNANSQQSIQNSNDDRTTLGESEKLNFENLYKKRLQGDQRIQRDYNNIKAQKNNEQIRI